MARLIFILAIIVVFLLTTVSRSAFAKEFVRASEKTEIRPLVDKYTLISLCQDDFESGIFSGWKQTADWEVSATEKITGSFSLKHWSKATSGTSSLFHALASDWDSFDLEWSFNLKNGNWDPSSSNRFWFYLSADTIRSDLITGWAAGVNISGSSDLLEIWRIRNGKADSLIVQSDLDWNASTLASIGVKRTARGVWTLTYQKPGEQKSKDFSGTDSSTSALKNVGLYFNYTSTRAGQLWLDDLLVSQQPAALFIRQLILKNSHALTLMFNKPVQTSSVRAGNFKLSDENGVSIAITSATLSGNTDRSVELQFGKTEGTELRLDVSGVSDLSGNLMEPQSCLFSYSFLPEKGSVLINELLFNPYSGGVDFVELANVSEQSVPVHRLKMATRNDTLALKQVYPVSLEKYHFKPGQLLCCTKDPAIVVSQYITSDPDRFCAMKSFPSYPDDAGTVVLLNDSMEVVDEFSYSAKMHSPFLADENGVSLERISLGKPTNDPANWTSAAASVGFASPGLPNSQTPEPGLSDEISLDPEAFSPNGDGFNDLQTVRFRFGKPGYIANVRIFDSTGRLVRFLVKNESLAQEGSWDWDGKNESGHQLKPGIYVVLVEVFDANGHSKAFKKACSLTDRLD